MVIRISHISYLFYFFRFFSLLLQFPYFSPGTIEKEFEELTDILDALYLNNHTYDNDLFMYDFKYARLKNDICGKELYSYIDKRTLSIIKRFLHRNGNNQVSDNISSISLDDNCLTVYIARNPKGEEFNYLWRNRQLNIFNETIAASNTVRDPIVITWELA